MKGKFGRDAARRTVALLEHARRARFRDPADLIRLHETVLYLRAYPQSARVLKLADRILFDFSERLRRVDLDPFEDPEISGIAGTGLSTNFSYEVARSLVTRHGRGITIDWENYARPDRLGSSLSRLISMAGEDSAGEPHVEWGAWFERGQGTIGWLLENVKPEIY